MTNRRSINKPARILTATLPKRKGMKIVPAKPLPRRTEVERTYHQLLRGMSAANLFVARISSRPERTAAARPSGHGALSLSLSIRLVSLWGDNIVFLFDSVTAWRLSSVRAKCNSLFSRKGTDVWLDNRPKPSVPDNNGGGGLLCSRPCRRPEDTAGKDRTIQ